MRTYGITNAAPAAAAPTVGASGDTYYNTVNKVIYVSDGAAWLAVGPGAGGPPTGTAGGDLSASYPNPTVVKAAGGFDVAGNLTVAGDTHSFGGVGTKTRMLNGTQAFLHNNHLWGTQDDAAKSSWGMALDSTLDRFAVYRRAAGGAVGGSALLTLDSGGNLTTAATAYARVTRTTAQSIPHAAYTSVTFDSITTNVGGLFSAGTPDRFTIAKAGFYLVGASGQLAPAAGGELRFLTLSVPAVANLGSVAGPKFAGYGTDVSVTGAYFINAGQYVVAQIYQDSGAALNLNAGALFWIVRVW